MWIGRSYSFVDFASHALAMAVILAVSQQPVVYQHKTLHIGWAKANQLANEGGGEGGGGGGGVVGGGRRDRNSSAVNVGQDSKTLFVGSLPPAALVIDLEQLFGTAAVSVRKPDGKSYAFVEFRSHAEAAAIVEQAEASVAAAEAARMDDHADSAAGDGDDDTGGGYGEDGHGDDSGGLSSHRKRPRPRSDNHVGSTGGGSGVYLLGQELTFGWAKGRPADRLSSHDGDCWFCLGSPSVTVIILCVNVQMQICVLGLAVVVGCGVAVVDSISLRIHFSTIRLLHIHVTLASFSNLTA